MRDSISEFYLIPLNRLKNLVRHYYSGRKLINPSETLYLDNFQYKS